MRFLIYPVNNLFVLKSEFCIGDKKMCFRIIKKKTNQLTMKNELLRNFFLPNTHFHSSKTKVTSNTKCSLEPCVVTKWTTYHAQKLRQQTQPMHFRT